MAKLLKTSFIPEQSLLGASPLRNDYVDAYSLEFRSEQKILPSRLLPLFLASIPTPARWLLAVREWLAKMIGLKTSEGRSQIAQQVRRYRGQVGERIALFEVMAVSPHEMVTGQDDRHLHFRLSFLVDQLSPERYRLWLITLVQTRNLGGRIYLAGIKPFHRLLMRHVVRRMVTKLR